jgi:hypothetical protein
MGLPASLWPQPDAQQAQPQPAQHLDTSIPGSPVVMFGGGRQSSPSERQPPQSARAPQREQPPQFDRDEDPIPPGEIPDGGRRFRQARDEPNFLEKLFGQ